MSWTFHRDVLTKHNTKPTLVQVPHTNRQAKHQCTYNQLNIFKGKKRVSVLLRERKQNPEKTECGDGIIPCSSQNQYITKSLGKQNKEKVRNNKQGSDDAHL